MTVEQDGGHTALVFSGRLDAAGAGKLWRSAIRAATRARGQKLRLDLTAIEAFDMSGAALLLAVEHAHGVPPRGTSPQGTSLQGKRPPGELPPGELPQEISPHGTPTEGTQIELIGVSAHASAVLARARHAAAERTAPSTEQPASPFAVLTAGLDAMANGVAFLGEAVMAVVRLPTRLRMLRLGDLLIHADHAGARALPLVLLLGFLMGMILAFQSAIPMRRFGADLFVANLVTISLIRELGPLLSAVILAGRTGSAFAAEIGIMKVNQEVDALVTMGIDPMTMLVLPRLIAVMLVLPALALALDIAGLLGMTTVLRGFGIPMVSIVHQVQSAAGVHDLLGGLFKAACFGVVIAAIGCRAGLATGNGPRAVGLSATAAVVGGIVSTIILDGLLALIFYRLSL
jgi:phospholipid/cholesterol/gamma-HCH transport system permease protein